MKNSIVTRGFSCFLILLCFTLLSCDRTQLTTERVPNPGEEYYEKSGCDEGKINSFVLDDEDMTDPNFVPPANLIATDGEFLFELQTPSFQLSECLCVVDKYFLVFDELDGVNYDVFNSDEIQLTVDEEFNTYPTPDTIFISNIAELSDELFSIVVDFDPVVPDLVSGGGLCVVDNFDLLNQYNARIIYTNAVLGNESLTSVGDTVKGVWIPTKMTTVVP